MMLILCGQRVRQPVSPPGGCKMCGFSVTEGQAAFQHTHEAAVPDHEMIQHFNVKHFSSADNLAFHDDGLRRPCCVARGVIMTYNDRGTVAADSLFEDFADSH